MSNYCVTGHLDRAAEELARAGSTLNRNIQTESKLADDITRVRERIERLLKVAKKQVPGGWKPPATDPRKVYASPNYYGGAS